MPRGGWRPGAGRKRGGKNQRTVERMKVTEAAAAGGITPLELMLQLMRSLWEEGTRASRTAAAKLATDAAPFVHPRLTAQTITGQDGEALVIKIIKFADLDTVTDNADEAAEAVH